MKNALCEYAVLLSVEKYVVTKPVTPRRRLPTIINETTRSRSFNQVSILDQNLNPNQPRSRLEGCR